MELDKDIGQNHPRFRVALNSMTGSWQEEEKAEKVMEAETRWCFYEPEKSQEL